MGKLYEATGRWRDRMRELRKQGVTIPAKEAAVLRSRDRCDRRELIASSRSSKILPPVVGTKREVFEQIVRFTLSNDFAQTWQSVGSLMRYCTRKAA